VAGNERFTGAEMKKGAMITDADLQDYIEGRLHPSKQSRVESQLASDPNLKSEVERLRRQASQLRDLGRELLDDPIPEEWVRLIRNSVH
jgi:anti-sigma factor RsiW